MQKYLTMGVFNNSMTNSKGVNSSNICKYVIYGLVTLFFIALSLFVAFKTRCPYGAPGACSSLWQTLLGALLNFGIILSIPYILIMLGIRYLFSKKKSHQGKSAKKKVKSK